MEAQDLPLPKDVFLEVGLEFEFGDGGTFGDFRARGFGRGPMVAIGN